VIRMADTDRQVLEKGPSKGTSGGIRKPRCRRTLKIATGKRFEEQRNYAKGKESGTRTGEALGKRAC